MVNLRDVITFQGESVDELRRALRESVDDYLAFCAARGEEPEKPYSGTFTVRIPPELHRDIALRARMAGKSLNGWVSDLLGQAAALPEPPAQEPNVRAHKTQSPYLTVNE